jgi:hypothetical protein
LFARQNSSLLVHVIQRKVANEGKMWSVNCRCSTASCVLRRTWGLWFNLGLPYEDWTILCLFYCIIIRILPVSVMTDELQSDPYQCFAPLDVQIYLATPYHTSIRYTFSC